MNKIGFGVGTLTLVCAASAPALADDYGTNDAETQATYADTHAADADTRTHVEAPRKALEIGVNAGYTQGFGALRGGSLLVNPADAGFGVGADLGYRVNPRWSIVATGQYNQFSASDALRTPTNIRGSVFSLGATYHTMPFGRLDPWLNVGAGYRLLSVAPDGARNDTLYHGFQLAKLQVGLDVRASKDIAIGPVIGGDLNYFAWQNPEQGPSNQAIADRRVSTFVFAGVQGRFDVGGTRETRLTEKMVGSR